MSHAQPAKYPKLEANIKAIQSVHHVPVQGFSVGLHRNASGENMGSLTILGFAKLYGLREDQVLSLFGEAAEEVLKDPDGTNHPNIRAFLKQGLSGVTFYDGGIRLHSPFKIIEDAWEDRASFSPENAPKDLFLAVDTAMSMLDSGQWRTAMKLGDGWFTNQALKKAVLLSFRLSDNKVMGDTGVVGFDDGPLYFDKVPLKFRRWKETTFREAGFRVVPGAVVRRGSFIGKNVVLMPSFVNIGAYVDEGTMVDTWATVGSCAQIGSNCHLSGGVGIGGVLEPLQANPTIIEDNCFIGARSEVVEGVIVRTGAVLSMGVFIGKNTPIVDRTAGNRVIRGEVPPYAVVMMGVNPENGLICPHIVKYRDEQTDAATALNSLLRS